MERLSYFIISIIIASMSVICIGIYYTGVSVGYGVTNNQNISEYSQMAQIQNLTTQFNDQIEEQPTSTGGFNVLGDFLSYGYYAYQLGTSSLGLFGNMIDHAFTTIPTGGSGAIGIIKLGVVSIVVVIIVFLIIAYWSGRSAL